MDMNRTESPLAGDQIDTVVRDVLATTSFVDIHTHLFSPALGQLGLWGIDALLTYHYLEAELFRFSPITASISPVTGAHTAASAPSGTLSTCLPVRLVATHSASFTRKP